jgi:hypothetical protein
MNKLHKWRLLERGAELSQPPPAVDAQRLCANMSEKFVSGLLPPTGHAVNADKMPR